MPGKNGFIYSLAGMVIVFCKVVNTFPMKTKILTPNQHQLISSAKLISAARQRIT